MILLFNKNLKQLKVRPSFRIHPVLSCVCTQYGTSGLLLMGTSLSQEQDGSSPFEQARLTAYATPTHTPNVKNFHYKMFHIR